MFYMKKFVFFFLCILCGVAIQAQEGEEITFNAVFSDYEAGTQYADNEKHVLNNDIVIYTTDCHFTTELRIYSSTTYNGYVIGEVAGTISSITFNAGNKKDVLLVYGSSDGENWKKIGSIETLSTAYWDYTLDFGSTAYSFFKLDVEGENQIRLKSMKITYIPAVDGSVTSTVASPVLAESCNFTESMVVSLSCETKDATIYYTVDGTEPTRESGVYAGPFTITQTTTVRARAVKEGMNDSEVVEATYTMVEASSWRLVTDAANLNVNDRVVLVSSVSDYAMSINQKTNNRGAVEITRIGDGLIVNDEVQILTLEEGSKTGTFAFNTGSGYLYAASSSNNYLKTKETKDANGSWIITITDGVASIVAQGANTHNVMQYNQPYELFSCYASANQNPICIYKAIPEGTAEETFEVKINKYGYATLFLDKAVAVPEGLTAYYCTVDGTAAVLHEVGEVIPAATGVVLRGTANTTYTLTNTAEVNDMAEKIEAENRLMGYVVDTNVPMETDAYYALNAKNGVVGFFIPQTVSEDRTAFTAKANKAYLKLEGTANVQMLSIRQDTDGDETAVENRLADSQTEEKVYYDLTGRRVDNPGRGIYIVGGKKVVIK